MKDIERYTVSILMAAYNSERFILDAINSVFEQNYNNWELIICDDCSTDGTLEICKQLSKADDRIIYIRNNKNYGQSYARNRAFSVSRGQFITILDSDDLMNPQRIKKQLEFLINNPQYAFVGSNSSLFNDSKKKHGQIIKPELPTPLQVLRNKGFVCASIMVRRDIFQIVNGYTVSSITRTGEDYDLICKIYIAGGIGANLPEQLYKYRVSDDNYKRRKYKCYVDEYKVALKFIKMGWLKKFNISKINVLYVVAPLFKGLIPSCFMKIYHSLHFKSKNSLEEIC